MADVKKLVRWPPRGGRPVTVLDLEIGGALLPGIRAVRDSWKLEPGQRTTQATPGPSRYGGERPIGDKVGNASVSATYRVRGSSVDDCLARIDQLLVQVEDARAAGDVEFEWRPEFATASRSSYYRIMGPGTGRLLWTALQGAQAYSAQVEVTWPVLPKALAAPMDVYDDYSVDSIADYFFDDANAVPSINTGRWNYTGTNEKRWRYSARGHRYTSVEVTRKVVFGASLGTTTNRFGIRLCILDDNNYLRAFWKGSDSEARIQKVDGGTPTDLAGGTFTTSPIATVSNSYWIRMRKEGDTITFEVFDAEPTVGTANRIGLGTHTLSGANATKFGFGIAGEVGGYDVPQATDWRSDDLVIRAYTWRGRTGPQRYEIKGVPGSIDAEMAVEISSPGGAAQPFGLVSIDNPTTDATKQPFGIHEAEAWTSGAGPDFTSTAVGAASGGTVMRHAMSGAGAGLGDVELQRTLLEPRQLREADDFDDATALVEIWMAAYLPTTAIAPKAIVSWQPDGLTGREFALEGIDGMPLVLPTASSVRRLYRVGTLLLDRLGAAIAAGRPVTFFLGIQYAAGSSGNLDIDYLMLASPSRTALTPTGRASGTVGFANTYPQLLPAASGCKRILPDLSTTFRQLGDAPSKEMRHAGLQGAALPLPPGDSSLLAIASNKVPDDPTASSVAHTHDAIDVHLEVRPAWPIARAA